MKLKLDCVILYNVKKSNPLQTLNDNFPVALIRSSHSSF